MPPRFQLTDCQTDSYLKKQTIPDMSAKVCHWRKVKDFLMTFWWLEMAWNCWNAWKWLTAVQVDQLGTKEDCRSHPHSLVRPDTPCCKDLPEEQCSSDCHSCTQWIWAKWSERNLPGAARVINLRMMEKTEYFEIYFLIRKLLQYENKTYQKKHNCNFCGGLCLVI